MGTQQANATVGEIRMTNASIPYFPMPWIFDRGSTNSHFENIIFHRIHNFKISFFTKFTKYSDIIFFPKSWYDIFWRIFAYCATSPLVSPVPVHHHDHKRLCLTDCVNFLSSLFMRDWEDDALLLPTPNSFEYLSSLSSKLGGNP